MTSPATIPSDPITKTSSVLVVRLWILGLAVLLSILGISGYYQWVSVRRNALILLQAYAGEYATSLHGRLTEYVNLLGQTDHVLQQAHPGQQTPILQDLLHQQRANRDVVLLDTQGRPIITVGAPWSYPSLNPQLTPQTRAAWRGCPAQINDCVAPPVPAPHHPDVYLVANVHRLIHPMGQALWLALVHPQIYPGILQNLRRPYPDAAIVVVRQHDHLLQMRNPAPTQIGYGAPQSGILMHVLSRHPDMNEGSFSGTPTATGVPILGVYARAPGWPFIVGVNVPRESLIRIWLRSMAPLTAILVGMGFLGTALLHIGLSRLREAEAAREVSQAAFRAQIQTSQNLAIHDPLTGLLNRRGMEQALSDAFARAQHAGDGFGMILMDLDRFKLINDSYGHPAGDRILLHVADLLRAHLHQDDAISRWGGEEFLILLPRQDLEETHQTAQRLREAIAVTHVLHDQHTIHATASLGITTWSGTACTTERLIARLDSLLYDAKRGGRNQVKGFEGQESHILSHGAQIQVALDTDRIRVAYQTLVDLHTDHVVGYEALARMVDPDGGTIPANAFIHAAHRLRLEHRIDTTVSQQALRRCFNAQLADETMPRKFLINCSADFLSRPDCIKALLKAAEEHRTVCGTKSLNGNHVIIEVTERQMLARPKESRALLQPLLDFGFELAVDDFGSGYSSFLYLLDLPVKYLKIEMELVQRATTDPRARTMVQAIQAMAHHLAIKTIAEGIETAQSRDLMRAIGVDWGQGYLWGQPVLE
ncbi:MAG: EAL domain-containing protein [Betaproteobacteria bacterium]|nr:EAL domain-containing protein [Betaproteobacteria bacterium]MDE2123314.1 EAL domain-containing protein [Betaproteobacteria bacterium]MDE2187876.1 EAL domain-containing protein [Betaproteobacteria bacterium]MDE2323534.1 EAL domain-containing protein [Betaproteobacteria bacterium]